MRLLLFIISMGFKVLFNSLFFKHEGFILCRFGVHKDLLELNLVKVKWHRDLRLLVLIS